MKILFMLLVGVLGLIVFGPIGSVRGMILTHFTYPHLDKPSTKD